jgi:hypothetical protein
MIRAIAISVSVVLLVAVTGCRQPDGTMPPETGEVPNRLIDISRDLQSAAGGDSQAGTDLGNDLAVFVGAPGAKGDAETRELSRRVAAAIAGKTVAADASERLARQLWHAVAASDLSARQIEKLQEDMKETMTGMGVAEQQAEAVMTQVAEVQKAVTDRTARWYELF